jgi:hypothetical protein
MRLLKIFLIVLALTGIFGKPNFAQSPTIVMLAPQNSRSFSLPTGRTYQSSSIGLITNIVQADITYLQSLGCVLLTPRNNTSLVRAPLATDDFNSGYGVGSQWYYISGGSAIIYNLISMTSTSGSAVWVPVGSSAASIPAPTVSTLGGVFLSSAPSHKFANGVDASGNIIYTQPAGTDLTGVVGVANGGTGTGTAFTTGSVPFAGASGTYAQDNAQFFWDETNKRLGIGTATPSDSLQVVGSIRNSGAIYQNGAAASFQIGTKDAQDVQFLANNAVAATLKSGGNFGVGTTSPGSLLSVAGNQSLPVGGFIGFGGPTVAASSSNYSLYGDASTTKINGPNGGTIGTLIGNVSVGGFDTLGLTISSFNAGTGATSSTFWRGDRTWAAPPSGKNVSTNTLKWTTPNSTVTITNASPAVITWTAHGFSAGIWVLFTTTGTLPTGLTASTPYCIISAGLAANSFEVATACAGAAINTSSAGSGTHTGHPVYVPSSGMVSVKFRGVGGGGSGGAVAASSAVNSTGAAGGGGGAICEDLETAAAVGSSVTLSIGPGGTAPTAGFNSGNAGTQTSAGSFCIAPGGTAGGGANDGSAGTNGGNSASATGNIIAGSGQAGGAGFGDTAQSLAVGGFGGSTLPFAVGGPMRLANTGSIAGTQGSGCGAGGSGAASSNTGSAQGGGAGSTGCVIAEELIYQ